MTFRSLTLSLGFLSVLPAGLRADAGGSYRETIRPLLEANCFECHAEGAKKGGVDFDKYATDADLLADKELWHRVLKNVRAHMMPPPDADQPEPAQRAALEAWIKSGALGLDPAHPDPGRPVLRRLNRTEYRNTVKDLTGVDYRVQEEFPADDTGHGFDNIGSALTLSPMMLEKYLAAAKAIVSQAVPQVSRVMPMQEVWGNRFFVMIPKEGGAEKGEQRNRLGFYENVTVAATIYTESPGRYALAFELNGLEKYVDAKVDLNRVRLHFKADGVALGSKEFAHGGGKKHRLEFTADWQPGPHELTVEVERLTDGEPVRDLGVSLEKVVLSGPEDPAHWVKPANYDKWFGGDVPADPAARLVRAKEILAPFVSRAFRRPAEDATLVRLAALGESVWSQPGATFEAGISRAMEAVLASPRFLFQEEYSREGDTAKYPLIDEFSLASRLSYFLWSTLPDEELTRLASAGKLRANLPAQLSRMLKDERAGEFFRNFPGQWLQARDVEGVPIDARSVLGREQKPDPALEAARQRFRELRRRETASLTPEERKEFDEAQRVFRRNAERFQNADFGGRLRSDMRRETEMYFRHIITEDRPLTELIDADYTFLNGRLARHYGVPDVQGDEMRLVKLPPDSPRGGVLTQGTVLAVTSNPTRTSPVKRGLFILDNILGSPPPPPPPDIPSLEEQGGRRGPEGTLRETLMRHRADAKCASCHNRMDPLGLAFENFNAMGSWRDAERGEPVDPAGKLISGEEFSGARELKAVLVRDHKSEFYRCFIEKLFTYALGRHPDWRDEFTLDALQGSLEKAEGRPSALILALVEADVFQRRRSGEHGEEK